MKEAKFYKKLANDRVSCQLCPKKCLIDHNKYGNCNARKNINGTLFAINYGKIVAINLDPIEKKPLYHFKEGSKILSIGTAGCNLHCSFCQNHSISQFKLNELSHKIHNLLPEELLHLAIDTRDNIGVAYTYNEPSIWYEYILDSAKLIKENKLITVMVSNGYISKEPLENLAIYIDAFSIDLKSYDNKFYKKFCTGTIDPVINNIKYLLEINKHVEIDYLVIPGLNDDLIKFEEFIQFYKENFGKQTPLHINRYFPCYKMKLPPTPKETIKALGDIAYESLDYVHLGNMR